MKEILTSIKAYIIFSILLGLIYPLTITGIAQIAMSQKANGSLLVENGKTIGSSLIGQKFDKPEYFNSRSSAVDYNAAGSGASNLGPSSKKLMKQAQERTKEVRQSNGLKNSQKIPADMVLESASGLDPHISIENAELQAKRIVKIRGISQEKVNELIKQNTDYNFLGLWGQYCVNVLKLNLALNKVGK